MTTKKTIIISAATCLVVNLALYLMGWLVWPLLWVGCGYLACFLDKKYSYSPMDGSLKFAFYLIGPIGLIIALVCLSDRIIEDYKVKFPKIRNPFFWQ